MSDVWSIRSFLNTDTPSLSKIWLEHHSASGSSSACSVHLWDQCILSKVYFQSENLLLAVDDRDQAIGMVHFGPGLREDCHQAFQDSGVIHLLCVAPHPEEARIAELLLDHAVEAMRTSGIQRCIGIGSHDASLFYLGIADGDNLMGVPSTDTRTAGWLQHSGFHAATPTESWELPLDAFRPPMDRIQIAIRRSCSIGRILEESHPSWWVNTVLGHCDQSRFHLVSQALPRVEMEILFWYPDATIRGVDSHTARLVLPPIPTDDTNRERLVCLIAEASRQLQQERKRSVRVIAAAQHPPTLQLLQRLGFRSTGHGMEFALDLSPTGS